MSKKLGIGLVLIAVLAAAAVAWLYWERPEQTGWLGISGNIEMTEVDVAFKIPGKIVELTVEEGDMVHKGDLIARLDQEQLLRQRDEAAAALKALRSRLQELKAGLRFQEESSAAQIQQREAEVQQAQANLDALLSGSRQQEIEQAQAAVERAQTQYRKAESDWERAQSLIQNEDISQQQFDQYQTAFEAAQANLEEAKQRLALVVEGPRREDIEAGRALLAGAQSRLRLARSSALEIRKTKQAIQTAGAEIERGEAELARIDSQLKDSLAEAPIDGAVMVKSAELGEVVAAGMPLVTLGDLDRPWLRGYIPTEYLGRVKLGSRVKVSTDSFPGKVYEGEVSFISPQAEFTPKQIETHQERVKMVYRIKVRVENPDRELKLNMPCDAEILID